MVFFQCLRGKSSHFSWVIQNKLKVFSCIGNCFEIWMSKKEFETIFNIRRFFFKSIECNQYKWKFFLIINTVYENLLQSPVSMWKSIVRYFYTLKMASIVNGVLFPKILMFLQTRPKNLFRFRIVGIMKTNEDFLSS